MIMYRIVFWMLTICSAVVETNAEPINILKYSGNKRTSTVSPSEWTSPPVSANARTTDAYVVTSTTVKLDTSRDVYVHVEKTSTVGTDAMINKLCSDLVQAVQENRGKADGVTTASGRARSSPVTIASRGRRKSRRHFSRKTFPLSSPSHNNETEHDFPSVAVQPVARYRDPILVQEVSQMDYLTSYPLEREIHGDGTGGKDYEDSDKPAMVWKTAEVGNPFARKNVMYNDDDDDDDDDS